MPHVTEEVPVPADLAPLLESLELDVVIIAAGVIGRVVSVNFSLQWDQTWIAGLKAFESIKHMVLADFAIHWFDNGFIGTMGELLCAIEDNREPSNSGADVLQSLELCFQALRSADENRVVSL